MIFPFLWWGLRTDTALLVLVLRGILSVALARQAVGEKIRIVASPVFYRVIPRGINVTGILMDAFARQALVETFRLAPFTVLRQQLLQCIAVNFYLRYFMSYCKVTSCVFQTYIRGHTYKDIFWSSVHYSRYAI